MVDQTRFTTEQMAYVVLKELLRPLDFRHDEGNFFVVELKVPIRRTDHVEDGTLTIYIERLDLSTNKSIPLFRYKNRDAIIDTVARLSKEGKPFDINVFIPFRESKRQGATITVSEEMERIILKGVTEEIERELS